MGKPKDKPTAKEEAVTTSRAKFLLKQKFNLALKM